MKVHNPKTEQEANADKDQLKALEAAGWKKGSLSVDSEEKVPAKKEEKVPAKPAVKKNTVKKPAIKKKIVK